MANLIIFFIFFTVIALLLNQNHTGVIFSNKMNQFKNDKQDIDSHLMESIDESKCKIITEIPEEGFVILNGVKRKIEDCKNL